MKKILIITATALILFVLAAAAFLHLYVTPERLTEMANQQLDEKLEAEIGSASFNPFTRTLTLGDVSLSAVKDDESVILFRAEYLQAGPFVLSDAWKGEVSAGKLIADNFYLDLTSLPDPSVTRYSGRTATPLHAGGFELTGGELLFPAGEDGRGRLNGLQLSAGPATYHPDEDTKPGSLIRNLNLNVERLEYRSSEDRYLFTADSLTLSETDSLFRAGRTELESLHSEEDFFSSLEFRKDLFLFSADGIHVTRLDLPAWLNGGDLIAGTVSIENGHLHVTSDKRIPKDPDADPKPLPQQLLKNLPYLVSLDTLQLHETDIHYSEYDEEGTRPGTIRFIDTHASLIRVSNRPDEMMQVNARSYLEGSGVLETEIRFYTEDRSDIITVNGSLGTFDLTLLNPILMDLEGIEITGGTVSQIHFGYRMTASGSAGTVQAQYDGFSMDQIQLDDHSQSLGDHLSGAISRIVIRSSSGSDGEETREGAISEVRDPDKSFFNYLWISLRSGLMDIVSRL